LHKEYEALRLRNQLDPKRFYRKDPGEGRGIKGLPKHFAVRLHPFLPFRFLQCPFDSLAQLFQRAHRSVDQVVTIYRALLANARLWMN
jgi:hypothetical protein